MIFFLSCDLFQETISHVIHLAGLKAVRQSHGSPLAFYSVNVVGTINLLEVWIISIIKITLEQEIISALLAMIWFQVRNTGSN